MSPLTRGELAAMLAALMLTLGVPREVTAYRRCKADGARCNTNQSCCSGICTAHVCGTPTTTNTSTTTSSTTTTSTTSSTTTTTLRFVDNGDGTVTDNQTGLQWEQKVAGSSCLHCVNDTYIWSSSGTAPDGTAFTSFLATLNGGATGFGNCTSGDGSTQTGGFNNHCDWRLPTIAELATIIDTSASGCGTGSPCIDATFGPTAAAGYPSSTTNADNSGLVWGVNFGNGSVFSAGLKTGSPHVRAVR